MSNICIPYNSAASENHRSTLFFSIMRHPKASFCESPETGPVCRAVDGRAVMHPHGVAGDVRISFAASVEAEHHGGDALSC